MVGSIPTYWVNYLRMKRKKNNQNLVTHMARSAIIAVLN